MSDPGREQHESETRHENGNLDYKSDIDHPLDLSFTQDFKHGAKKGGMAVYASD